MSIFTSPPTTIKYSFRRGDNHIGVWAIQKFLIALDYSLGSYGADGDWGPATDAAVKSYQTNQKITVDGIVGPQTQSKIVTTSIQKSPNGIHLPAGLAEGQIQAESGRLLAAVNPRVPGGIDCGLVQQRVYGPPFDAAKVRAAFDPFGATAQSADNLLANYTTFSKRVGAGEYAWRLAALAHNWPWGADTLSKGGSLSTTERASWAEGAHFTDGAPVLSYRDWAEFYALGSRKHRHAGLVTQYAFGVPTK